MSVYLITYRQRATKEYAESTAWYKQHSLQAAENFTLTIENTIAAIAQNPYSYKNSYKTFYEAKAKKISFSIVYLIDETKQLIVITTLFHQKRNPYKKFRQ